MVSALQPEDLGIVGNILLNPPAVKPYAALRIRLCSQYAESEEQRLRGLISGMQFGDHKPSRLLLYLDNLSYRHASRFGSMLLSTRLLSVCVLGSLTKVLPDHHPLDIPRIRAFARSEPKDVSSDYVEQEASKGKGAFIQALWTLYAKSSLYCLAYKAWKRHGSQSLTTWTLLAQAVFYGCYAEKWPDTVFQVPNICSICLSSMHWPEKTHCSHGFHLQCLLQHLDVSNTCPLGRAPNPLRTS
ncbi:uncharacterized protein TNCV_945731 [Trichonephila clavipes]|nr:uncharacterized protein TNCV_945731 [Trichonephila clavipes]